MSEQQAGKFDEWAILELMGHRKMAGKVSEAQLAGGAFIRIDVPGDPGDVATQFYSPSAVYCITPTKEEIARRFAAACQPAPISHWDLQLPARSGRARAQLIDEDDMDEESGGPEF